MLYDVYVQGKLYKTVEAEFTHQALTQATLDIQNNLVPAYDPDKPSHVVVRPANLEKLTETDVEALFKPASLPSPLPRAQMKAKK